MEGYYHCNDPTCAYRVTSLNDMKKHDMRHAGERPLVCLQCTPNQTFTTESDQGKHNRHYHPVEGEATVLFACNTCQYTTRTRLTMVGHVRYHTGEKPYPCTWPGCPFRASLSGNRDEHVTTHTGDRRHQCGTPGCIYSGTAAGSLDKHIKAMGHVRKV